MLPILVVLIFRSLRALTSLRVVLNTDGFGTRDSRVKHPTDHPILCFTALINRLHAAATNIYHRTSFVFVHF